MDYREVDKFLAQYNNNGEHKINFEHISQSFQTAIKEVDKRIKGEVTPYKTKWNTFNKYLGGGLQKANIYIIGGRPGCLAYGTNVRMFDGSLKQVQDIKEGDLLMGVDSTPRKVESLCRGVQQMYLIKQLNGISYEVNEDHVLSLKRSRTENCYKQGDILNISVKEYLTKSTKFKSNYKAYKTKVEYSDKPTLIEPYFMGLWLGDGTTEGVGITTPDIEIKEYLEDLSNRLSKRLNIYDIPDNKAYTISIRNKKGDKKDSSYQVLLRKEGVLGNKHIPNHYLYNSRTKRLDLLAGIIDTDGYLCKESCFEVTQKKKVLADNIIDLARGLGFRVSCKEKLVNNTLYYRMNISGNIHLIPTRIKRKQAGVCTPNKNHLVCGFDIIPTQVKEYYGFSLDGDNLFLLEDYTVTHNSGKTSLCNRMLFDICEVNSLINTIILYWNFEMPNHQQVIKEVSAKLHITVNQILSAEEQLALEHFNKMKELEKGITSYPIWFHSRTSTAEYIKKVNYQLQGKFPHHTIINIGDHTRLASKSGKQNEKEEEMIHSLMSTARDICVELEGVFIWLSQLNRNIESPDRRATDYVPQLTDLFGADALGQYANVVMIIQRPEIYNIKKYLGEDSKNLLALHILKNRSGEITWLPFEHNLKYNQIVERI